MITGSSFEKLSFPQDACKAVIFEHFAALNLHPGETGTCKKMLELKLLEENYKGLGIAFSKRTSSEDSALIHKERACLQYLSDNGYPVVRVYGSEFVVEQVNDKQPRYGMLMDYIDGIFIEAKTLHPLKPLILACLLQIPVRPQEEVWLGRNLPNLKIDIAKKLLEDNWFNHCQEVGQSLLQRFECLQAQFTQKDEIIVDLQMLITKDGDLVIIDPLDVVNKYSHKSVMREYENTIAANGLSTFICDTQSWVNQASAFCQQIVTAKNPTDLIILLNASGPTLIFSGDPQGKSRINQLKAGKIKPFGTTHECNPTKQPLEQTKKHFQIKLKNQF